MQKNDNQKSDVAAFKRRLYQYVIKLVQFLNSIPRDSLVIEVQKQLIRSGTSIGANYFEARNASSKRDFQNYFNHSLKSANESHFWLCVLRDSNLVPEEKTKSCQMLAQETRELANIFAASLLTMRHKR